MNKVLIKIRAVLDSSVKKAAAGLKGIFQKVAGSLKTAFKTAVIGAGIGLLLTALESVKEAIRGIVETQKQLGEAKTRISALINDYNNLNKVLDALLTTAAKTNTEFETAANIFSRLQPVFGDIQAAQLTQQILQLGAAYKIAGNELESFAEKLVELTAEGEVSMDQITGAISQYPELFKSVAKELGVPFDTLALKVREGAIGINDIVRALQNVQPPPAALTMPQLFSSIQKTLALIVDGVNRVGGGANVLKEVLAGIRDFLIEHRDVLTKILATAGEILGVFVDFSKLIISNIMSSFRGVAKIIGLIGRGVNTIFKALSQIKIFRQIAAAIRNVFTSTFRFIADLIKNVINVLDSLLSRLERLPGVGGWVRTWRESLNDFVSNVDEFVRAVAKRAEKVRSIWSRPLPPPEVQAGEFGGVKVYQPPTPTQETAPPPATVPAEEVAPPPPTPTFVQPQMEEIPFAETPAPVLDALYVALHDQFQQQGYQLGEELATAIVEGLNPSQISSSLAGFSSQVITQALTMLAPGLAGLSGFIAPLVNKLLSDIFQGLFGSGAETLANIGKVEYNQHIHVNIEKGIINEKAFWESVFMNVQDAARRRKGEMSGGIG